MIEREELKEGQVWEYTGTDLNGNYPEKPTRLTILAKLGKGFAVSYDVLPHMVMWMSENCGMQEFRLVSEGVLETERKDSEMKKNEEEVK